MTMNHFINNNSINVINFNVNGFYKLYYDKLGFSNPIE